MKQNPFILYFLAMTCLLIPVVGSAEETLTLMTHDSFNISKELIAKFEEQNRVKLRVFKAGDAGAALVQAILSKENPMADVFFGVDNTFFSRAISADIFESYNSPQLKDIPTQFRLDDQNRLLPVDYGDVCLNYDKAWFAEKNLAPPTDLADLVKPAYKGLTVVENPATSSPGMAFLLPTMFWWPMAGKMPTMDTSLQPPRAADPLWSVTHPARLRLSTMLKNLWRAPPPVPWSVTTPHSGKSN